jgi:ferrochelatase
MRYFKPFIGEAIDEAYKQGYRTIVLLPLYPQYSNATTGSSFKEVEKVRNHFSDIKMIYINNFHDNKKYIKLLKEYIDQNIEANQILLFSAHSLPKKFVDEGDPYVTQIKRTAELAAGNREFFVSFQSRTGPVEWVGPDTINVVKRLLKERSEDLFIVPISFVSDHIETLYEIDIEIKEIVGRENAKRIFRMPLFNDNIAFGEVLADVVISECRGDG